MLGERETVLRLLLAALVGGLIGIEREVNNRPAGLRTHLLVTVGSSLFMMIPLALDSKLPPGLRGDPYRIGAQVVSGIGFLGAGTIIKTGIDIRGLTTAASLWVSAGVGLAIGAGYYFGALVTAIIVLLSLVSSRIIEGRLARFRLREIEIIVKNRAGIVDELSHYLENKNILVRNLELRDLGEDFYDKLGIKIYVKLPVFLSRVDLVKDLASISGVESIKYDHVEIE